MSSSPGDPRRGTTRGTSRPGRRHRRDAWVSVPVLAMVATAGGLGLLLRQHPGVVDGGTGTEAAAATSRPAGPRQQDDAMRAAPTPSAPTRPATASVVLGRTATTVWGDVRVRITVRAGRIVAVTAVEHPHASEHSRQINDHALPILYREAVAAQSAGVDAVSGATITSTGYRQSLQSAIDQAQLRR